MNWRTKCWECLKHNIIKRYWVVIVLLLFTSTTVLTSGHNGLITLSDTFFPFHPIEDFFKVSYSWFPYNLGFENITALPILSMRFFPLIFDLLGVPLWIINRLWFVLPVFLLGLSMYYLSGCFFENKFARFLAALFYMCNPLVKEQIMGNSPPLILANAVRAFTIAFLIKGLREKESSNKYIIYAGIIFIFGLGDLHGSVLTIILSIICLVFFGLLDKRKVELNAFLSFTLKSIVIVMLVSAYVLLPTINQFLTVDVFESSLGNEAAIGVLNYTKPYTSILNVSRLIYGSPTPYGLQNLYLYNDTLFGPLSVFFIIIFACSVLLYKKISRAEMFFVLLALISTLFSTGINKPFGIIFEFFWNNFKWFRVFRNPMKFVYFTALAYSIMIGFAYVRLLEGLKDKRIVKKRISILIVVLILSSGWPIFTGNSLGRLVAVNIPKYYDDARKWLIDQAQDFRVLTIPFNNWYVRYDWTPYDQQNIVLPYLKIPVIAGEAGRTMTENTIDGLAYLTFHSGNNLNGLDKLLALMNVKYVLLQKDFYKRDNVEKNLVKKLDSYQYLERVKSFGKLDFYKIADKYFLPHIYPALGINLVASNINTLVNLTNTSYLDGYPALALINKQQPAKFLDKLSNKHQSIPNKQVLLANSQITDLVVDMAGEEKDISYLFYPNAMESHRGSKNNGLAYEIGQRDFSVLRDREYVIKTRISPRRAFLPDKRVIKTPVFTRLTQKNQPKQKFADWQVQAVNTSFKKAYSENGLLITALFDGNSAEKEEAVLSKSFPNIDLEQTPYAAITFKLDDPSIQTLKLNFWIAPEIRWWFPSKVSVNVNLPFITSTPGDTFLLNIHEKVRSVLPSRGEYLLSKVEIFLGKRLGVDASHTNRGGEYNFTLSKFRLLKEQPLIVENQIAPFIEYSEEESFYYVDQNNRLKQVSAFEEVPQGVATIYEPQVEYFLDLQAQPTLDLTFTSPAGSRRLGDVWVELGLDFDGDNQVDGKVKRLFPTIAVAGITQVQLGEKVKRFFSTLAVAGSKLMVSLPALGLARQAFPNKQMYHLLNVALAYKDKPEAIAQQNVLSYNIQSYQEYIYTPEDLALGSPVLQLDDRIYKLPEDFGQYKKDGGFWLEFGPLALEKGEHKLFVPENKTLKVELVEIKSVSRQSSVVSPPSEIKFKKINPTKYLVDVKGAKGPFTLVFSESFHEGWKAYIRQLTSKDREPWSALWSAWQDKGKRVEIEDHFVVNGYANGWIVPVDQHNARDFEIVLEYKSQRLFEAGLLISATTLLGCFVFLGYDWGRKRKNKKGCA